MIREAPLTPWRATNDPVTELVLTLLSQNTSDTNSGRAFQQLLKRYPDWDAVLEAPVEELEETIRPGGLARTKAPRMQALLGMLRERLGPGWDASRLEAMPIDEAKTWLTELPGVGPKTAACVLLFSLGRPALPVDTHVHRVAQRLGLIGSKVAAVPAHDMLEALLPPGKYYDFHVTLIRHGRRVCHKQRPKCADCVLLDRCPGADDFIYD
ncbi:MAG: endonuclease III [Chloroflexota bacterium]|nr:endonuclease III [Chloroflexota bacterium]